MTRSSADIRAIEIESDALGQSINHFFAEAGVGARRAGLSAVETLFDAVDQRVIGATAHMRMRADHLLNLHEIILQRRCGAALSPLLIQQRFWPLVP